MEVYCRAIASRIFLPSLLLNSDFWKAFPESKCDLIPFWSYRAIVDGKEQYLIENIMNVVVFIPIGFLLGVAFMEIKWKIVLLIGLCLSIGIEMLQFVYLKGFTEFDDLIHNTFGCMIGYGLYSLIRYGFEWICKRRLAVL